MREGNPFALQESITRRARGALENPESRSVTAGGLLF